MDPHSQERPDDSATTFRLGTIPVALSPSFFVVSVMFGLSRGFPGMASWVLVCFVSVLVRAQLAGFDRALEEAALDLGARPWTVLMRITIPGISPALVSGWLLAFTLSLDDLVVASFVTGPSATTLPMAVFSSVRLGVSPEINALATLFLLAVFALVALAGAVMARAERRRRVVA